MNQQGHHIQCNKNSVSQCNKNKGADGGIPIPKHVAQGIHKAERKSLLCVDCVNIIMKSLLRF
jgi:hypothetical protein